MWVPCWYDKLFTHLGWIVWIIIGIWHITKTFRTERIVVDEPLSFQIHRCFHIPDLMIANQFQQSKYSQSNRCRKWTPCSELCDTHLKIEIRCVDMVLLFCDILSGGRFTSVNGSKSSIKIHWKSEQKFDRRKKIVQPPTNLRWEPKCHLWTPCDKAERYHNRCSKCHQTTQKPEHSIHKQTQKWWFQLFQL